ncbi:MAG: hypothetical protein CL843_19720 [Crocinitomicaceae bacterium]|uniref:hypothetical protein n=1 Tax=uncultured Thalassospira sp. TaxID=404382 RepID=UPI000C6334D6|nr:hypothetical protein [Crocinitomicaceae bacterium]|tara:strand:+ start:149 stop:727 length:579 start_codon:yes stop_codon:yes gene_type:complete
MSNTKIRTASGALVDLMNPQPADICFRDIAHALSQICRFTGHTIFFYSVGQHSLHMVEIVSSQAEPYALLHDAKEAFIQDLSTPMKSALDQKIADGATAYRAIDETFDAAIFLAAGLQYPMPQDIADEIKEADALLLAAEQLKLMHEADMQCDPGELWKGINPQDMSEVRHAFGNACQRLLPRFNAFEGAAE